MIHAYDNPTLATKHESKIGYMMLLKALSEGHMPGLPRTRSEVDERRVQVVRLIHKCYTLDDIADELDTPRNVIINDIKLMKARLPNDKTIQKVNLARLSEDVGDQAALFKE